MAPVLHMEKGFSRKERLAGFQRQCEAALAEYLAIGGPETTEEITQRVIDEMFACEAAGDKVGEMIGYAAYVGLLQVTRGPLKTAQARRRGKD